MTRGNSREKEDVMRHEILSDESLEIMREIWARPEASINDVWTALNAARRKKVRRTTVQVQMTRLVRYGWLSRRKSGREYLYAALYGKDETVGDLLSALARRVYGGSFVELVGLLLERGIFSPADRRRINVMWRKIRRGKETGPRLFPA